MPSSLKRVDKTKVKLDIKEETEMTNEQVYHRFVALIERRAQIDVEIVKQQMALVNLNREMKLIEKEIEFWKPMAEECGKLIKPKDKVKNNGN